MVGPTGGGRNTMRAGAGPSIITTWVQLEWAGRPVEASAVLVTERPRMQMLPPEAALMALEEVLTARVRKRQARWA